MSVKDPAGVEDSTSTTATENAAGSFDFDLAIGAAADFGDWRLEWTITKGGKSKIFVFRWAVVEIKT